MRLDLVIRGMCMGIADIIPGVSGGTMALVLGIYGRFVDAVKSLNAAPIVAFLRLALGGFSAERRRAFGEALDTVDWRFLLPLGTGIATAMGVGSVFIPSLMDSYPAEMRGLFFGLILASVGVPLKMMPKKKTKDRVAGAVCALLFLVVGFLVTDPNRQIETVSGWTTVQAEEATQLKKLIRRGPSAASTAEVFWHEKNGALRFALRASAPDEVARLEAARSGEGRIAGTDKHAMKERAKPYDALVVPAGTAVSVPRPAFGFIFLAGMIAICAMILPGISGSFILLILGCYYFVLSALKGTVSSLVHFESPGDGLLYVLLFVSGCVIGIVSFSRLLSWLLHHLPAATMGALVGLMLGCLRGVWPWRATGADGVVENVIPAGFPGEGWQAAAIAVVGMLIALGIEFLGARRSPSDA